MAKQLNVDLRFNADVSAAKAQLQNLQTSINQLTTSMAAQGTQLGITPRIQEAQQAAIQLKTALSQSVNVETGKFDLSKFNSSLKSMNTDLSKLKTQLVNLGPSGQQTFMTLAQSIMTAEIPTKRISASLAALGTTLKNTVKWQLSSTMLHGFMSAVQTSYRYAQDLNESLNNIRIVTGESAEAMDRFAAKANKAAKALSASTLDYTDAALIFYQQGLKGKDVEDRTEVTLKLANVSRQSAEVVSDQMTAIWNNFYDGSKSLEYYADVLTALGASTASSTEEIAGGLEKFAAVGETIGLSYEYAASALATITANTRQSEEVVGTALKTIFARIQGLKLGETLEDGTSLNKYSQALEAVGVHIYNASGGLKQMDTILDETAEKWGTLTQDQQAALAQTVAGVRQYTQFIALMDNWNDGTSDSMVNNLKTANESMGALQEQQDIYAESWEAARDRAQAAAEELYMSLLDDDFFIGLTDGFADFLGLLDNFIDAMGGAKGLLSGLASILLYTFSGPAAKALENMVYNFKTFVGLTQKEAMATQAKVAGMVSGMTSTGATPMSNQQTNTNTGVQGQVELQHQLLGLRDKFSETDILIAQGIIEQNKAYAEQVALLGEALDLTEKKKILSQQSLNDKAIGAAATGMLSWENNPETVAQDMNRLYNVSDKVVNTDLATARGDIFSSINANSAKPDQMKQALLDYAQKLQEGADEIEAVAGKEGSELANSLKDQAQKMREAATSGTKSELRNAVKDIQQDTRHTQVLNRSQVESSVESYGKKRVTLDTQGLADGSDELKNAQKLQGQLNAEVEKHTKNIVANKKALKENTDGIKTYKEQTEDAKKKLQGLGNTTRSWSQTMVGAAQGAMSLSFAISSLKSLKTTWADDTIGAGEKLLQTFMSLGMAIPMLVNGINSLKNAYLGSATVSQALVSLNQTRLAQHVLENNITTEKLATMQAENLAQQAHISLSEAEQAIATAKIITKTTELGLTQQNIGAMTAEQLVEKTGMTLDQASTVIKGIKNGMTVQEALAEAGLTTVKGAGVVMTKLATAANWGFLASMSPLLAITLVLVAAIAGLALVIWGVVSAVKFFIANSPEGKMKAAREESAALTEQLNQTKKAAEDLKSAFDDYDSIREELAKCTKGTEEWNEALQKNNQHVLDMLDKFPELAKTPGAIKIGADGQLIIDEGAREKVTQMANDRVATATIAANAGKQKVRDMEIEQLQKDVDKKATRTETTYTYTGQSGTNYDRSYTTSTQKVDTNAKKIFEAAANKYGTNNINATNVSEIIQAMKDSKQLDVNLDDSKLIEQTMNLANSEQELMLAVQANTVATQAETAASGASVMAGNTEYEKSDYKGLIAAIVGANGFDQDITLDENQAENLKGVSKGTTMSQEDLASSYKEAITDESNWKSILTLGIGKFSSERAQDTFKQYTDLMGLDQNKMQDIDFRNDGIYYKAIDENGVVSDQETKIDFNTIANTLAADASKGNAIEYGEAISKQMNSFKNRDQAEIFAATAAGNSGLLSEELLAKNQEDINKIIDSMEISEETLQTMKEAGQDFGDTIEEQRENFKKYQKEITKSKKGFNDLKKNGTVAIEGIQSEWKKTDFKVDEKGLRIWSDESKRAAAEVSKNLSDALGADGDLGLDPEFIGKNKGIIEDFMNDVEGSGARLKAALREDAIIDVTANMEDGPLKDKINNLHNSLSVLENKDWQVGVGLDPTKEADFYQACQNMIDAAGMTADQAQQYFGKMGYDVKFKKEKKKVSEIVWNKKYNNTYDDKGNLTSTTVDAEAKTIISEVEVPVIETITPNSSFGGNIDSINNGGVGGSTKTTGDGGNINPGGGGKNTPKNKTFKEKDKKEKKLYEDEFDRYRDITTALDEYNRELEETQELKDELWGADKLAVMDAEKKKLSEITKKQREYIKAISGENGKGGYLKTDMEALKQLDPDAKFDENGNLTNYHELTQKWLNEMNAAQETWNTGMENITNEFNANKSSESADETYDAAKTNLDDNLEKAEDIFEKRKAALDKWQETYDLNEEQKQQLEDYLRQMRQLNYEKLEYKIEIRIELNENDLKDIEHQLNRLGEDNVYASAERIALIEKNATSYKDIADAQIEGMREAKRLYEAGEISQENYMTRLKESKEAIQDAEQNLRDGIQQIGEELINTFDLVDEKLDRQFAKFDNLITLMDHYKQVVSLTDGEASYKQFNQLLRTSQKVLQDRIEATKSEIGLWEAQETELKRTMSTMDENSPEYLAAEKALESVQDKLQETKEQLMSDIEQLGEYAREIFENSIEQAVIDFEEAVFGGKLSGVIESIEMMNARQEELLTTTNKIYETNKMLRNIEKDIEATTNQRAKQAYNEFAAKVKQKQEQNELTKFELDLLTAEYEITKAQIALEEAQNAKDTVRLTRDSEGNYGYVYTANENKVADAEQKLEDATNSYYNTALEGAQNYQDLIYQHIEEWEEKVTEVMQDQTLSEEKKDKKIAEITAAYDEMIRRDKELYYIAIDGMRETSYNKQVDYDLKGIKSAENWFTESEGFIDDLSLAQKNYDLDTQEVATRTEQSFGKMSTAIGTTTKKAQDLNEEITTNLIPTLDTELKDSIDEATLSWWKYVEALQKVIELTDEAMKKQTDENLTIYKEDYSAEISKRLANNGEYTDYDIQQLLKLRWEKMGGKDNTDYQALINAGGTAEQIALWEVLRQYKIDRTDWKGIGTDWANDIREDKMNQDFSSLIIDYLKSSNNARWSDTIVQNWLIARQAKLDENPDLAKTVMSNAELKEYVAKQIGKDVAKLRSGGYTGEWGPEGKLAMLHEKELVLNKDDTTNFLTATQMLREISQMLDNNALIASLGAINLHAMTIGNPADQILQQEVTIHADFPNVTDHNEIEIAIDNLINAASQHAFKS